MRIVKEFLSLKVRRSIYIPILVIISICYLTAYIHPDVEVEHVYKVLPAFIIYTDKPINTSRQMFVWINKENRELDTTRLHELTHVKQAYRSFFLYWIPFILSEETKQLHIAELEAEAYAPEIQYYGKTLHIAVQLYAELIQEEYNLDQIDIKWIKEKLYKHILRVKIERNKK